MFCPHCGKKIADHVKFCPYCGQPVQPADSSGQSQEPYRGDYSPEMPQDSSQNDSSQEPLRNSYGDDYTREPYQKEEYQDPYTDRQTPSDGGHPGGKRTWLLIVIIAAAAAAAFLLYFFVFADREENSGKSPETAAASSSSLESVAKSSSGSSESINPLEVVSSSSSDVSKADGFDAIAALTGEKTPGNLKLMSSDVSDYPNVRLYYSFRDNSGQPLTLSSPTAGIKEKIADGTEIERTVRSVERLDGNQGLSIDIVADKSSSMSSDMDTMKNAMDQFVTSLDYASGDEAELISFDSYIMYMCTYTDDVSRLQNGISNMSSYGDTALYDALITGINNAGGKTGAKCVIGFTDGEDNRSSNTSDDVIRLANEKEVPVYIIGTAEADSATLENIATQTGGAYWTIDSIGDMTGIMEQIYSDQKDLYCVEYESDKNADPYAARDVSCVIADRQYGGEADHSSFTATKAVEEAQHSSRYEAVKKDITWTEANNECLAKGGHLVTITSQDEMNQVCSIAESAGIKYCWIGGYTSVRDNQAYGHWITGEDFNSYTAWYPGEPSRNDKDGTPEFYLMLWNVKGQWSWNDQRDDVVNSGLTYFKGNTGYIIEYED